MKYKVLKQDDFDERVFEIEDPNGDKFKVDLYTDGAFPPPLGVDETAESWREWLRETFEGKTMEIERIVPYRYFTRGKQIILQDK